MRNINTQLIFPFLISFFVFNFSFSQQTETSKTGGNPFIKHLRSADPAAKVWKDGKVWVYASRDEPWAIDYASMDGYHVYSSYDLVNWTDHGEILHSRDVTWARKDGGFMFAPDAAYKDGTYYLYFPHLTDKDGWKVGVATSKTPEGPFIDIGRPITGTDNIDPSCFVDENGEAYLIWRGGSEPPVIAKLKDNMTELAEAPRVIDYGGNNYGEGPFMHKYNGKYYFSWTCHTCSPDMGFYSMGDNPYGPFEYKGAIKSAPPNAQDHHSMLEYHGQWYYFYHRGDFGEFGTGYRRSLCVDSMFYNQDGTIQRIVGTDRGVAADFIGSRKGEEIPGVLNLSNAIDIKGMSSSNKNEKTEKFYKIQNEGSLSFVLDIASNDSYQFKMNYTKRRRGTKLTLYLNNSPVDSLRLSRKRNTISTNLDLPKGKHVLKLQFGNEKKASDLLVINGISIQSANDYFTVESTSSQGASILSEGSTRVKKGDAVHFKLDWPIGFKPTGLFVNNKKHPAKSTFTLDHVFENSNVDFKIEKCKSTPIDIKVFSRNETITATTFEVDEGTKFKLVANAKGNGNWQWQDCFGEFYPIQEFMFHTTITDRSGTYTAIFTDEKGCKSAQPFQLDIKRVSLEVHRASDFIKKHGIQKEAVSDLGGGESLAFIQNGDWITYQLEVDKSGEYDLVTRVASGSSGGDIEISIENEVIGSVPVEDKKTDGWQDWYTTPPVKVQLNKGVHMVKFTFRGGEGYLFNMNWFDLKEVSDLE